MNSCRGTGASYTPPIVRPPDPGRHLRRLHHWPCRQNAGRGRGVAMGNLHRHGSRTRLPARLRPRRGWRASLHYVRHRMSAGHDPEPQSRRECAATGENIRITLRCSPDAYEQYVPIRLRQTPTTYRGGTLAVERPGCAMSSRPCDPERPNWAEEADWPASETWALKRTRMKCSVTGTPAGTPPRRHVARRRRRAAARTPFRLESAGRAGGHKASVQSCTPYFITRSETPRGIPGRSPTASQAPSSPSASRPFPVRRPPPRRRRRSRGRSGAWPCPSGGTRPA